MDYKRIFLNIGICTTMGCAFPLSFQAATATQVVAKSPQTIMIKDLISKIEKESGYLFYYSKSNVNVNRTVTINKDNKNVKDLLDDAFNGTSIRYVIKGKNIVLTENRDTKSEEARPQKADQTKKKITGKVVDKDGLPIIGATVQDRNDKQNVAVTDADGNFTLTGESNTQVVVSYLGYAKQTAALRPGMRVVMKEDATTIDDVVVTAMGLKKKEASLTYSTQQIKGDELTRAKDPNMITALAGKAAGVQINRNSSGLGGSAKVIIRGIRSASASGNNQPLYVIDGMPMLNNISEQAATAIGGNYDAGNRDSGDGISELNPDDIESINILKGASASALYGSQAANGVILITTKHGSAGMQRITYSSNMTFDRAFSLPEFQNNYAEIAGLSWGEKGNLKNYDNVGDFFGTGTTAMNTVSLSLGNNKTQTYFSYANTTGKGIIDSNKLRKHNLTFRETANFFNNKLRLDGNTNLVTETVKNRPTPGGYYMNPLVGLYTFPRGKDMTEYREGFEKFDVSRNMNVQNWYTSTQDFEQNPYWIKNRVTDKSKKYRAFASLTAALDITDWLTLQGRGNVDYSHETWRQKMYASTAPSLAGNNGRYINFTDEEFMVYGDFMAQVNKQFGDWHITGALGGSVNHTVANTLRLDSWKASLYYPNVFTVANINMNTSAGIDEGIDNRRTTQSVFGTAQLGWHESLFLDVTARNDWSSTLAYTHSKNSGFFYPSVGLTWVLNKSLKMPQWVDFGKIRGSWAKVGNDIPLYVSNPVDVIGAGGKIITNDTAPFEDLKPELSTSWEFGTEWKFFGYRLYFDATWYRTMTKNQLLRMPSSAGADYKYYYVNAGEIRNQGVELTLGGYPIMNDDFNWKTEFNFSTNSNKVVKLHPDLKSFAYGDEGFSAAYMMRVVEGGKLGDIYGNTFVRNDDGTIKTETDDDGDLLPVVTSGNHDKVGNAEPKCLLGWSNSFTYKGLTLYFLIDSRFGGDVLSMTQAELDKRGVSKASGEARDRGYVDVEGIHFNNPEKIYKRVGGRACTTSYYMYSATNVRLRELSLSYALPSELLAKTGFIKGLDISFIARNLFFFHKDAPFDPDAVLSTGNANQGVDVFGMPTTRSMGFNVKFTF